MKIEDGLTPERREQLRRLEQQAREIARSLDLALNPKLPMTRTVGFGLMLFDFGPQGLATWISNADRESMIRAVEQWLAKAKARS